MGLAHTSLPRALEHAYRRQLPRTPLRAFSVSHSSRVSSPLWNLSGLSASRESQFLAKESKVPRTEYHPHLQLIRSSEVDPFAAPGATPYTTQASKQATSGVKAASVSTTAVAELVTALRTAQIEAQRTTDALEELYRKYRRTEMIGAILFLTTLGLVLLHFADHTWVERVEGWLKPEQMKLLKDFQRNWEERCHWMFAGGIRLSQEHLISENSGRAVEESKGPSSECAVMYNMPFLVDDEVHEEARPTYAPPARHSSATWSCLFWSSPS